MDSWWHICYWFQVNVNVSRWLFIIQCCICFFSAVYVTYVLVLSTLSLLFTVLLLILTFNDDTTEPPKWLRALAFGCVAKVTCKERCCPKKNNDADVNSIIFRSSREKKTLSSSKESLEIDKSSATTYQSSMRVSSDFPKIWICEKKERASTETAARSNVSTISLRPLTTDLASLLHKNPEYKTSAKEEWLEIAQLFDRILLIFFFIATMVIIIVVFAISPNIDNDFRTFSSEDQVLNTKIWNFEAIWYTTYHACNEVVSVTLFFRTKAQKWPFHPRPIQETVVYKLIWKACVSIRIFFKFPAFDVLNNEENQGCKSWFFGFLVLFGFL